MANHDDGDELENRAGFTETVDARGVGGDEESVSDIMQKAVRRGKSSQHVVLGVARRKLLTQGSPIVEVCATVPQGNSKVAQR